MATEGGTDTYAEFREAVNMTASELERWLGTDESKEVGQKPSNGGGSIGHDSGRKIIKILRSKKGDLTDVDEAHMRKVVSGRRRSSRGRRRPRPRAGRTTGRRRPSRGGPGPPAAPARPAPPRKPARRGPAAASASAGRQRGVPRRRAAWRP